MSDDSLGMGEAVLKTVGVNRSTYTWGICADLECCPESDIDGSIKRGRWGLFSILGAN